MSYFEELVFTRVTGEEVIANHQFDNGYSVSVTASPSKRGTRISGLYEMAASSPDNTEVPVDVNGWLTDEDVDHLMSKVAALPANGGK